MKRTNHKSKSKSSEGPAIPIPEGLLLEPPRPPLLRPHCGIWAEPGRVEIMFRLDVEGNSFQHIIVDVPPKDGSLPVVRGPSADQFPLFITVPQAAQLCRLKPKTFYTWIETGKVGAKHGLRRFGRECRLELRAFRTAIDRGEFGSCS